MGERIIGGEAYEQDLVVSAQRGASEAFELLFDRYAPSALALAKAWTGSHTVAEEVLQDSFVRVWLSLKDLREPGKFRPWLWRIVVNCARDSLRSELRARREATPDPSDPSASRADDIDKRILVHEAVSRLPDELRAAITLFYLADLTEREAASVLGWRLGTLKSRLHRARDMLAESLRLDEEDS